MDEHQMREKIYLQREQEEKVAYDLLLPRLQRNPIHERFRAVHLIQTGKWRGSGVFIVDRGKIITCAHLFPPQFEKDYLFYHEFQLFSQPSEPINLELINSVKNVGTMDAAICSPGTPALIGHTWESTEVGVPELSRDVVMFLLDQPETCVNLATGEVVPVLGWMKWKSGKTLYLLLYRSYGGESGAGFMKSHDQLYVLKEGMLVGDDHRKFFSIPEEFEWVTLATLIKIH